MFWGFLGASGSDPEKGGSSQPAVASAFESPGVRVVEKRALGPLKVSRKKGVHPLIWGQSPFWGGV